MTTPVYAPGPGARIRVSLPHAAEPTDALKGMQQAAHDRTVEAGAAVLAGHLRAWMRRAVARELTIARRDINTYIGRRTKQQGETPEEELRQLLLRFGIARARASGEAVAAHQGGEIILPGDLLERAIAGKPVKVKWFEELVDGVERDAGRMSRDLKDRVRDSIRETIDDANKGGTRATATDIARRISRTVAAIEPDGGGSEDKVYLFSHEHALSIARTEMVQVENTARMAGFDATGVEGTEWLAYSDGRSGHRHHERMKGVVAKLGAMFTLPSGHKLRYPGDPLGDVSETANCRCTVRPARPKK